MTTGGLNGPRPPLTLSVDGTTHHPPPTLDPATPLASYLRDALGVTACKIGCGEGGCGACAVLVARPGDGGRPPSLRTLNACLAPLASLDGAAITTAVGVAAGAPAVPAALASHHASQCGFCTPGMVVACAAAAAAAAAAKGGPSAPGKDAVARALDGNLCRCTGYRPILDAARGLGPADVEDLCGGGGGGGGGRCGGPGVEVVDAAAAAAVAGGCVLPGAGASRAWASPRTLAEAWAVLAELGGASSADAPPPVIIAGNTGSGVFKGTWPPPPGVPVVSLGSVKELSGCGIARAPGGGLVVPGGATLADLAAACEAEAAASGGPAPRWSALATHLLRVAGAHVRATATVGGNLALAATRGLESDPATILAAAGAAVRVATPDGGEVEVALAALLGMEEGGPPHPLAPALGTAALITSLSIPPPPPGGELFFTTRTAARYSHAVADFNAGLAVGVEGGSLSSSPVVVFGAAPSEGAPWVAARAHAVEAALAGAAVGDPAALAAALKAARAAIPGADAFVAGLAEAAVAAGLGEAWAGSGTAAPSPQAAAVWAARPAGPPAVVTGTRTHGPPLAGAAPVGGPALKDRVAAQASGAALYTGDLPLPAGGLHAAPVLSTRARAGLAGLDATAALALPGVVRLITVADIPPGGSNDAAHGDTLFAVGAVSYVGQRLACVLGESPAAAAAGAAAVRVSYTDAPPPGTLGAPDGSPILSIADAVKADSFYDLAPIIGPTTRTYGDPDAALGASPRVVRGVKVAMPSQAHLYLEPQVALALPDEDGAVTVHSATQSVDMVQFAVSRALGLPAHKVRAACRRLGGGFGGKSARSEPIAALAAVCAASAGVPVRLALTRADDLAMIGGRCEMEATYSAGFDEAGRLLALDVDAIFLGGAQPEISTFIPLLAANTIDQNFDIPASRVSVRLAKCNLPPRTIMRAPGTLQAVFIIEHALETVSRLAGVDGIAVRARNLLSHPLLAGPRKPCAGVLAAGTTDPAADAAAGAEAAHVQPVEDGVAGLVLGPDGTSDEKVRSAFGADLPLDQYTIPRLWGELGASAELEGRAAAVAAWNADPAHPWTKRGLAATACRFVMSVDPKPAIVSIHYDGTVLVNGPAHEMGQGAATKTLLAACAALSDALTPAARAAHCPDGHLPLALFRVADVNTDALPNTGPSWGSTTSEAACEAVRQAAASLAKGLRAKCEELEAKARAADPGAPAPTWEALIKAAHPQPGFSASTQPLTAYAYYDGTQRHGGGEGKAALSYNGYGVAATEAEVDALTGAVTLLRTDVLMDAGHSLWPAGDIGQVEGGFVQGAGLMLSEAVRVDPASGGLLTGSLWKYKIPTADAIPRVLNVALAAAAPHARGVLSSKAVGEPPLLLAITALTATQAAVNAVRAGLGRDAGAGATNGTVEVRGDGGHGPRPAPAALLTAPATPRAVRAAIGPLPLAEWAGR